MEKVKNMKSKQIILFIIITFLPALLFAKEWQLTIQAKAKQIDGLYKSSVIIGEGENANTTPAAPLPPKYSCEIHSTPNWDSRLSENIHSFSDHQCWVISLNPHGNVGSPEPRPVTLTWNSEDFDDAQYMLVEGMNCLNNEVISNMKETTQFVFTGTNKEYFFSVAKNSDLSSVIHGLSVLSNISKNDEGRRVGLNVSLKNIVLKMQKLADF